MLKAFKNATIMPLDGTMDAFTGGLFAEDGNFVEGSVVYRGSSGPLKKPASELRGTYIYGGCLFAHFGHFIWESLIRLPAFQKCRDFPILFITPNSRIFDAQKQFFKSMGLKNRLIPIKEPVRVSNLIYLPPQASLSPLWMSDEMLDALAFTDFDKKSGRKIWLSRTQLKYGRIVNEGEIEERIARFGFEVAYPEKLPLLEQVRLVATSGVVAGFSGSQFFSAFFAKKILGKIKIFNRRKRVPRTIPFLLEKKRIDGELAMFDVEEAAPGAPEKNMVALEPDRIVEALARSA